MSSVYIVLFSQLYHNPSVMGVFNDSSKARELVLRYLKNNGWEDSVEKNGKWYHDIYTVSIVKYNILGNPIDSKWYNLVGFF